MQERLEREARYHQQELDALLGKLRDVQRERNKQESHIENMTRLWFAIDDCEQGSVEQDDFITEMFEVIRNYYNN